MVHNFIIRALVNPAISQKIAQRTHYCDLFKKSIVSEIID